MATVTGVVPYLSIIRQYLHDGQSGHHFYILMGASYLDEFGYDDELQKLASDHSDFITFVPTISRPDEEPKRRMGRRDWKGQHYRRKVRLKMGPGPRRHHLLRLRSPREMIEDVKDQMIPKGYEVKEERFWKEDD